LQENIVLIVSKLIPNRLSVIVGHSYINLNISNHQSPLTDTLNQQYLKKEKISSEVRGTS